MQDLRLFYNQNIYPELLHLEQRRRRLIRLLVLSGTFLAAVAALQAFIGIFVLTLVFLTLAAFLIAYLVFRISVFFQEFKPRVVGLLLDFIDNDVNFSFEGGYSPKGFIPKSRFLESHIFTTADDYAGEDLIRGQVRETPFELCELRVREFSSVRNRLDYIFSGVFLIGDFRRYDMNGAVLILPDTYRKYLVRSEKAFHRIGGRRVHDHLLPEFEAFFDTYATPDTRVQDIVSEDLQRAILDFRLRFQKINRDKEIYCSIIGDKIYLALTRKKDILEPSLWASNVSFEVILEFYEDLSILLDIVKQVDVMN
jgi:hypothetical protein